MWTVVIQAILAFGPGIVQAVEALFSKKPRSGADKLNASIQLILQGLAVAHVIDPEQIGQPETDLATEISNAIVKYNNARGIFTHSS